MRELDLPITTARLRVRPAVPDDLDPLAALWADPEVCRYLPFDALDRVGAMIRFARFLAPSPPRRSGERIHLVVELLDPIDDAAGPPSGPVSGVVGEVMLGLGAGDPPGVAELGWGFSPSVAGRGLATEAALALRDVALERLGCHRVEARLDPRNHASARLCARLGMRAEAHTRRDYPANGGWEDTAVWGVLAEDLTASAAGPDSGHESELQ